MARNSMSRRRSRSIADLARDDRSMTSGAAVESLVALEYPNGRTHNASIFGEAVLQPGQEFDLHGRRWRAANPAKKRRSTGGPVRILCRPITPSVAQDERHA
jgi:hypothetical protein